MWGYLSRGSPFPVLYLFGFDRRDRFLLWCWEGPLLNKYRGRCSMRAHYIGSKSGRNEKGTPIT